MEAASSSTQGSGCQAHPEEAQGGHFGHAVLQLASGDELRLEVAHVGVVVTELVLDARHLDGVDDRRVVELVTHHDVVLAQERLHR